MPASDAQMCNAEFLEVAARYYGLPSPACQALIGERIAATRLGLDSSSPLLLLLLLFLLYTSTTTSTSTSISFPLSYPSKSTGNQLETCSNCRSHQGDVFGIVSTP